MTIASTPCHPVRGRLNPAFLSVMDGYVDRRLHGPRRRLLTGLDGVVVEVGPGNGPTLRYLPRGTTVHAVEPNPHCHARLRRAAADRRLDLTIHPMPIETTDLADGSADAVTCSWVLCSVRDPAVVLREIRRILRPGGRFVFVEHVAAPAGAVRRMQRLVRRPWRWLFEGCHVDRDTAAYIRAAGFATVDLAEFRFRSSFVPIRPQITGSAVR